MQIEMVNINEIQPYFHNAKEHNAQNVKQIANSIKEFGFRQPIVIDKDGIIIAGHGRHLAAIELGMTEVPAIRAEDLDDEKIRAYRLADNKTNESAWIDELLWEELEAIDMDMSDFGFDEDLFKDFPEPQDIVEDEAPEPPKEPRTKLGDIYIMGEHRLICGDSTDITVIDRLMDGVKADIAITSPPYGESRSAGIRNHYEKGKKRISSLYASHDDDITNWFDLINESFHTMRTATQAQFINIQMLADNKRELLRFLNDNKDYFVDAIIWDKKKAPPQMESNILNNGFEFIFCFCDENASRKIPFADFRGNIANIIELSVGHNDYANLHKAVYPVELPAKIMEIAKDAASVLDPFGGTGTTMIACEQLNRKCYMCELDPRYCDVIVERWEKFTGKKAELLNG